MISKISTEKVEASLAKMLGFVWQRNTWVEQAKTSGVDHHPGQRSSGLAHPH